MTFKIRHWLYFFIPVFIVVGLLVFTWLASGWAEKNDTQKQSIYIISPIIFIVFIVLPLLTVRQLKTISRIGDKWTFRFPYLNTSVNFDNKSVENIIIKENLGGLRVPCHEIISIKTLEKTLIVNSLEIRNYQKFKQLIISDFKGKIQTKTQNVYGVIVDK